MLAYKTTAMAVVTSHLTSRVAAATSIPLRLSAFAAPKLVDEGAEELASVHHDAEAGCGEDRRVGVGVHGDDGFRAADAREVLARAGDAEGEVHVRAHHLPGEADLPLGRRPAGIDRRERRPDRAAEQVGELFELREGFGRAEPGPAGDDDRRLFERGLLAGRLRADELDGVVAGGRPPPLPRGRAPRPARRRRAGRCAPRARARARRAPR